MSTRLGTGGTLSRWPLVNRWSRSSTGRSMKRVPGWPTSVGPLSGRRRFGANESRFEGNLSGRSSTRTTFSTFRTQFRFASSARQWRLGSEIGRPGHRTCVDDPYGPSRMRMRAGSSSWDTPEASGWSITWNLPVQPELLVAERSRRLVEAVTRDARFRRDVTAAYNFTCAVTGLTTGSMSRRRANQLLDAAHIRPVSDRGPDFVSNGLALTPTVHRLFDQGLISARWSGDALELARSPHLDPSMVESSDRGTIIRIQDGAPLILPSDRKDWPSADQIRYHQREVFKGPESLVT